MQGLGGRNDLGATLARYEKQRNRETNPAFDWTLDLALLRGVNEIERLFAAIGADEGEASNFLGVLTGVVPIRRFFSPVIRLIGMKDFLRLTRTRLR